MAWIVNYIVNMFRWILSVYLQLRIHISLDDTIQAYMHLFNILTVNMFDNGNLTTTLDGKTCLTTAT